jgi:hypothetical protein
MVRRTDRPTVSKHTDRATRPRNLRHDGRMAGWTRQTDIVSGRTDTMARPHLRHGCVQLQEERRRERVPTLFGFQRRRIKVLWTAKGQVSLFCPCMSGCIPLVFSGDDVFAFCLRGVAAGPACRQTDHCVICLSASGPHVQVKDR